MSALAAVKAALANPPYGAPEEIKVASAKSVGKALGGVPDKEIEVVVKGLEAEEQAVLMKFLYRGLESSDGQQSSTLLLKWHGVLTEKAGMGLISRVLSESDTL
eukprot:CAMPEP_0114148918 /NCGR_PEP_ID=MMETSP0043_2-20121206/21882_1 /TAXON_ID=464988 /ORGANISM="Hemiselmis andersenii, Strain CCMP644" /LENGTH=103 /DNA_ID=CAMNT_0001243527 /DNA_START=77 /DNA_END=388 /DNA_ORIENTATION=-